MAAKKKAAKKAAPAKKAARKAAPAKKAAKKAARRKAGWAVGGKDLLFRSTEVVLEHV